jgi:Putative transmembrane protein (PGPGW)
MDYSPEWQQVLLWSSVVSVGAVIATIIAVPWIIGRLPQNYFARDERHAWDVEEGAPWYTGVIEILKNVVGLVLLLLGLIMLVTPGQGILTILAGLLLMNFPGKFRLERWLVMRPGVMRGLNWLRAKRGQAHFDSPAA